MQTYVCYNKGCPNGYKSTFQDRPEEYWASKGKTTPKNCQLCRAWKREQEKIGDTVAKCTVCAQRMRFPVTYRISFYKNEGPFVAPELCKSCERAKEEGKRVVRSVGRRRAAQSRATSLKKKAIAEARAQALPLIAYDNLSNQRLIHFGKHITGHPFSEVGQPMPGGGVVSATTLVKPGSTSYDLYLAASQIATHTGGSVYQYTQSNGNIVKVLYASSSHLEVAVFKPLGNGQYEPITSFDGVAVSTANSYMRSYNGNSPKWV